jgi:hypothetical protein
MQMIDVINRLRELDSANPNIAKPTMTQEKSMGTITNVSGKSTVKESAVTECGGIMSGIEPPRMPASFSLNATAADGDEVAGLLNHTTAAIRRN